MELDSRELRSPTWVPVPGYGYPGMMNRNLGNRHSSSQLSRRRVGRKRPACCTGYPGVALPWYPVWYAYPGRNSCPG
eukprot:980198-Rhodomonas_salina.1